MPHSALRVTCKAPDATRIPDIFTEAATLVTTLQQRGTLEVLGELVRINRQGGYCGFDIWLLLLIFFTTGAAQGVKGLWEDLSPFGKRLAALAGRKRLASPSSVSRALDAAENELVRPVAGKLLLEVAECEKVLKHPSNQTYDTLGRAWHVFDLDPTVTTLRQRALPEDEALPEPKRRARDTGAPGYSGRKRGDLQFRRVTVQHAGSGVWTHAHLSPGNGEGIVDIVRALDSIVSTCVCLELPMSAALVRADGEHGHVPFYTVCRERKLAFVTRLNRPKLYEDPDVLDRLRLATWYLVADSGAGPRRAAADLGMMTIHPGEETKRPDGSAYEPITVRVVASIFPKTGQATRGRIVDGWQVELFAADLPADAWPAPEVVTAYFGRNGEENRFAQEDRELGLDRIISYHLPGQELAALVGLSLWNLRLGQGFSLDAPPAERPVQPPRQARVDDRVPQHWPRDPVVLAILAEQDWPSLLARRPGWSWDIDRNELHCPDGRTLTLATVRAREHAPGRTGVIFLRPAGGCDDCQVRQGCFDSEQAGTPKHAEFSLPTSVASRLRERLARVRGQGHAATAPVADTSGPRGLHDSLFLPAEARKVYTACFHMASVRIEVELPPPEHPRPRLVATDVADKQRRRKTWADNLARYALPKGARVDVSFEGPPALHRVLGQQGQQLGATG